MKVTATRAALAATLGIFFLGTTLPAPAMAQDKAKAKAKTTMPAKKKIAADPAVASLQEALNKNGAKLKVDGLTGGKTRNALKKYQGANGLKATGKIDAATKAKLGL
ncbi:MAG: peptidoglycan-binding domain-containing protein [Proteobacteria bacterium]|nr:peptidoglycan-binding domain-containing protein [Pseudomonadota bacterium]